MGVLSLGIRCDDYCLQDILAAWASSWSPSGTSTRPLPTFWLTSMKSLAGELPLALYRSALDGPQRGGPPAAHRGQRRPGVQFDAAITAGFFFKSVLAGGRRVSPAVGRDPSPPLCPKPRLHAWWPSRRRSGGSLLAGRPVTAGPPVGDVPAMSGDARTMLSLTSYHAIIPRRRTVFASSPSCLKEWSRGLSRVEGRWMVAHRSRSSDGSSRL
jgi:hypothetical protein